MTLIINLHVAAKSNLKHEIQA